MESDTIVAIATPAGRGGVGIVRLSGRDAYRIGLSLSQLETLNPREAKVCTFYDATREPIDHGIILYFKDPHSFTGEDVIELQAHGSPVVLDTLVASSLQRGARLAKPGEFSERAFLNDKIDLAQAEAIADLIHASSLKAARMALKSLQGDFSRAIHQINDEILHLRVFVEAALDFPDEDIDFLSDGGVQERLEKSIQDLIQLKATATQGVLLREGITIVLAGRPNAGKSTLMNALAGREVAIVTDIEGTTRDLMREYIIMDDLPIHFIDTAGLRYSEDKVEQEGIKRAWLAVKEADCVLLVADITRSDNDELEQDILNELSLNVPLIKVCNKIDTLNEYKTEDNAIYISAKTGLGLNQLKEKIKTTVGYQSIEGQFLARRRHIDAINRALDNLLKAKEQLYIHRAIELLAEDLRKAHLALSEITGEFSSDDLLGAIFSSFCIGK